MFSPRITSVQYCGGCTVQRGTEQPPQYWCYPSAVLMLSPTVLILSPRSTEQPPQYWTDVIRGGSDIWRKKTRTCTRPSPLIVIVGRWTNTCPGIASGAASFLDNIHRHHCSRPRIWYRYYHRDADAVSIVYLIPCYISNLHQFRQGRLLTLRI